MKNRRIFLAGKRVSLGHLELSDLDTVISWMDDQEVRRHIRIFLPLSRESEKKWLENAMAYSSEKQTFGILLHREAGEYDLIGNMGLQNIDHHNQNASTGAVIGVKEQWGKGYGTEAKMILLNYAFNTLNMRKIYSSVYSFNQRSFEYQKKCGYIEEGRRKDQRFIDGTYHDEILTAVFRDDWLPLWEEYREKYLQ